MCSLAESNVYNSEERLFSGPSLKPSFVRFLNRTQRSVDVIWINYDGLRVKYKTLGPYEYFDVNTFVNHPWIFRDTESFDKMVVCNKDVFHPEPWDKASSDGVPSSPQRRLVCITIPELNVYNSEERLFSGPSLKPSFVCFLNRTRSSVNVIWINYDGLQVKYKTLGSYEHFDVDTFVNHTRIFRDTESFDKMNMCNKDVLYPEPWDKASSDGVPSSLK